MWNFLPQAISNIRYSAHDQGVISSLYNLDPQDQASAYYAFIIPSRISYSYYLLYILNLFPCDHLAIIPISFLNFHCVSNNDATYGGW